MGSSAIMLLVVSIVLIWGGLLVSAIHLKRNPTSDFTGMDDEEQLAAELTEAEITAPRE